MSDERIHTAPATPEPSTEEQGILRAHDGQAEASEAIEEQGVLHSHLHEHADGTVHNHFHRHEGGDQPHTHEGHSGHSHGDDHDQGEDHSHGEGHSHANYIDSAGEALPEHEHTHHLEHRLILEARNVSFTFPRAKNPVFEDISLKAYAGTMTAILGNNGAGKTTLLNLLGNLSRPTSGTVMVGNEHLEKLNRREIAQHIAYVSQQQRIPHLSVYDEVLLGRRPHVSWSITENDRAVVAAAIERLELEDFVDRYCDELSGGERQKVYIARALAQETEVLLLDEPTSALDPKNQMEVLRVIREITTQASLATVMVIHDINLALRFCDRFLLMRNGDVIARGGLEAITAEALSTAYDMPMRIVDVDGIKMVVM